MAAGRPSVGVASKKANDTHSKMMILKHQSLYVSSKLQLYSCTQESSLNLFDYIYTTYLICTVQASALTGRSSSPAAPKHYWALTTFAASEWRLWGYGRGIYIGAGGSVAGRAGWVYITVHCNILTDDSQSNVLSTVFRLRAIAHSR